jgi:TATA-box binding protein (TBP) (component of TFIID and TFIIIB)
MTDLNASMYKKTPLRISTMVATAHFGSTLNLNLLFNNIKPLLIPLWYPSEGILKFEHKENVIGESHRDALTKRKISNKSFFNQSTLVIRRNNPNGTGWKEVNLKLFANGGVQMTGIVSEEFAIDSLNWLINHIRVLPIQPFTEPPTINRFAVQLINSDFSVGIPLRRDKLHEIITHRYGLLSLLESTIYQGVNTKYYYNSFNTDSTRRGQCICSGFCQGQGDGNGDGQCKRITVSFFQTGNIIITGARNMAQINEAFEFVNTFMDNHAAEIIRPMPPGTVKKTTTRKKTKKMQIIGGSDSNDAKDDLTAAEVKPKKPRKPRTTKKKTDAAILAETA